MKKTYSIGRIVNGNLITTRTLEALNPKEAIENSVHGRKFPATTSGRKLKGSTIYIREVDGAELVAVKQ